MVVQSATFIDDSLFFLVDAITDNVTDPISSRRSSNSKFVMTSYPQRPTEYPLITITMSNSTADRLGLQTNAMDMIFTFEIRVWARNVKERDQLFRDVLNVLRTIQYTTSTGSIANELHDFTLLSAVTVDEEGDRGIKSRIMEVAYRFINVS